MSCARVPDAQGSFSFPVDEGAYLLLVVADLKKGIAIIDSQPVVVPLGKEQPVTVDLKGKHGVVAGRALTGFPSLRSWLFPSDRRAEVPWFCRVFKKGNHVRQLPSRLKPENQKRLVSG
jgi:hypothetical protein